MADWNERFLGLAHHIAGWSKDRKRTVGSVIVDDDKRIMSVGYNGPPQNVNDDDESRHIKPKKLLYFEHAERNSIFSAAKSGISIKNCSIYVTSFPCADCCRAIIQSGIKRVVTYKPDFDNGSWSDSWKASKEMFEESGVEIIYYEELPK